MSSSMSEASTASFEHKLAFFYECSDSTLLQIMKIVVDRAQPWKSSHDTPERLQAKKDAELCFQDYSPKTIATFSQPAFIN